jgi:hypothetical protein
MLEIEMRLTELLARCMAPCRRIEDSDFGLTTGGKRNKLPEKLLLPRTAC